MSDIISDGGPAFPRGGYRIEHRDGSANVYYPQDGMSLRDWFAGQALAGICGNGSILIPYSVAVHAYAYADAMLEKRVVAS